MKIILGCQETDIELKKQCEDFFGIENIEVLKRNGTLSIEELSIIISITSLTLDAIIFLYTILSEHPEKNEIQKEHKDNKVIYNDNRRVLITKNGTINLEGYSVDEVTRILNEIYNETEE